MPAITSIRFRRGTAAQWTSANPVLAAGEMGLETDTRKFKFGNGSSQWNSIAYASAGGGDAGGFFVSETAPVGPNIGDIWYCTATVGDLAGKSFIYYDGYWVEINPGTLGPKGETGAIGPQGPQGEPGLDGVDGAPYGNIDGGKANTNYGGTVTVVQGGNAGSF